MNPMVNAGAIATTALVPAATSEERWARIQDGLSPFAGRRLELDGGRHRDGVAGQGRDRRLLVASAVGTALAGALLVGILTVNIGRAVLENAYLPEELVDEVSLESTEFVRNDQLRSVLEGSSATE